MGEVSRGHSTGDYSAELFFLLGSECLREGLNGIRWKADLMEESSQLIVNIHTASDNQLPLGLSHNDRGDEMVIGRSEDDAPVKTIPLMERVVARSNLIAALHKVQRNKGSAGIDGMTVDDLPAFLKQHWPDIRSQLFAGTYQPKPVKQVLIPKPDGGKRKLGIPTVLDRLIQQALLQVLQLDWDRTFSDSSLGSDPFGQRIMLFDNRRVTLTPVTHG